MRYLAPLLLLGLAACNRHGVADVTLDADATQRNATGTKTISDLQAAEAASRGPAPIVHDAPPAHSETGPTPAIEATPAGEEAPAAPATDAEDSQANE
jgi:hypothetical protein